MHFREKIERTMSQGKQTTRPRRRKSEKGSIALFAIVALLISMMLVFVVVDTAMTTRLFSKRLDNGNRLYLLAHAGTEYGYWKYVWQGASLPYVENNRIMGNGTVSVRVEDNDTNIPDTFKVTATSRYEGKNFTIAETYPSRHWYPVSLAPYANTRYGSAFPFTLLTGYAEGKVTYGNVPFLIENVGGNNCWNAFYMTGANPRTLKIPVSFYSVTEIHLLLNTFWGKPGNSANSFIEVMGTNGAYYKKDLKGNDDIRDYNAGLFTNSINNNTTKQVYANGLGTTRLDKIALTLPNSFSSQILTSIRLVDNGSDNGQRLSLFGVTVHAGR